MVVWGYPCESKSSPAHYSKHPLTRAGGVFLCREKKEKGKNKQKSRRIKQENEKIIDSEKIIDRLRLELFKHG